MSISAGVAGTRRRIRPAMVTLPQPTTSRKERVRTPRQALSALGWARTSTEAASDPFDGRCTATLSCANTQSFPGNEPLVDAAEPSAPRSQGTHERKRQTGFLELRNPGR